MMNTLAETLALREHRDSTTIEHQEYIDGCIRPITSIDARLCEEGNISTI